MSRSLPPHASLEHLKKQAKRLLSRSRPQQPEWTLADAQHALARGYGFASWPKLKAHVTQPQMPQPQKPQTAPMAQMPQTGEDVARDSAVAQGLLLAGDWVANVPLSTRHAAYPFRSARVHVDVHGDRLTLTQAVVDPSGHEVGATMTMVADGRDHAADYGGGHQLNARWLDPFTLEAVDKKDGVEVGRGTYTVSRDGRQMVVATDAQRIVFDRA